MGSKPVTWGTRMSVVVGAPVAGYTVDEVCAGYGIAEADVRAALANGAGVADY
jgi:uncharacterized protein (DUF433 family)